MFKPNDLARESAAVRLALHADMPLHAAADVLDMVLDALDEPEPAHEQPRQTGFDDDADYGDCVPADRGGER